MVNNGVESIHLVSLSYPIYMPVIIEINETNFQQVAQLSIELWPDCDLSEMSTYFEEMRHADVSTCFLLQEASNYIGFIELNVRNDYVEGADDVPVAYIEGLYVQKEFRHKRLGLLLIQKAEEWARSKGFKQLCSDTELENETSISFHHAAGFTEVSRIICFAKSLE